MTFHCVRSPSGVVARLNHGALGADEQWEVDVVPGRHVIVTIAADLVGPSRRVLENPAVLIGVRHAGREVLVEPWVAADAATISVRFSGVSCCQAMSAMTLWPRAFQAWATAGALTRSAMNNAEAIIAASWKRDLLVCVHCEAKFKLGSVPKPQLETVRRRISLREELRDWKFAPATGNISYPTADVRSMRKLTIGVARMLGNIARGSKRRFRHQHGWHIGESVRHDDDPTAD